MSKNSFSRNSSVLTSKQNSYSFVNGDSNVDEGDGEREEDETINDYSDENSSFGSLDEYIELKKTTKTSRV